MGRKLPRKYHDEYGTIVSFWPEATACPKAERGRAKVGGQRRMKTGPGSSSHLFRETENVLREKLCLRGQRCFLWCPGPTADEPAKRRAAGSELRL